MGNIPSSVALHQNNSIVVIENVWMKLQISILNLNKPKSKWDPQFIISIKLVTDHFEYALLSAHWPKSTEFDCNVTRVYQKSGKNKLERGFQISKHQFISKREH